MKASMNFVVTKQELNTLKALESKLTQMSIESGIQKEDTPEIKEAKRRNDEENLKKVGYKLKAKSKLAYLGFKMGLKKDVEISMEFELTPEYLEQVAGLGIQVADMMIPFIKLVMGDEMKAKAMGFIGSAKSLKDGLTEFDEFSYENAYEEK